MVGETEALAQETGRWSLSGGEGKFQGLLQIRGASGVCGRVLQGPKYLPLSSRDGQRESLGAMALTGEGQRVLLRPRERPQEVLLTWWYRDP